MESQGNINEKKLINQAKNINIPSGATFHSSHKIDEVHDFIENLQKLAEWSCRQLLKIMQNKRLFIIPEKLYSIKTILNELGVSLSHHQQIDALLEMFVSQKIIYRDSTDLYKVEHSPKPHCEDFFKQEKTPDCQNELFIFNLNFMRTILDKYLAILADQDNILNVFFPGGSFQTMNKLYKQNIDAAYYNDLTAQIIYQIVENNALTQKKLILNILEIGAGTGSTSEKILSLLKNSNTQIQYYYTDISHAFLMYGRQLFEKKFSFINFIKFDLNQEKTLQGLQENNFDVIVATNAIHNSRNIEFTLKNIFSLLKPGASLVLNEGISKSDHSNFIYGLTPAWRNFTDAEWRIPGTPLISLEKWKILLAKTKLKFDFSINFILKNPKDMNQDIIVAKKPS